MLLHRKGVEGGMKLVKIFSAMIFLCAVSLLNAQSCDSQTSSTILKTQSISQSLSLETALHTLRAAARAQGPAGGAKGKKKPIVSFEGTGFYFRSFNAIGQARDFFPAREASIIVAQDNTNNVSSAWVGIVGPLNDTFKARVTFTPQREAMGAAFKLLVDFGGMFPDIDTALKDIWTSYYMPITHLRHNLNFQEEIIGGLGLTPGFADATQAFNNPAVVFTKLPPNILTATAIDDMQWRVGWDFCKWDRFTSSLYWVLFIPAGKKPEAKYLFEPVIGNGGHIAPGLGLMGSYAFWRNPEAQMSLIWELRWNYLMNASERRTFDLRNGDWTRYLLVTSLSDTLNPIPGVNWTTRDALVTPRNMVNFVLAFNYIRDSLVMELGYELWWRQLELVTLDATSRPFAYAVRIFGFVDVNTPFVIYDISGCCPKTSLDNARICIAIPGAGNDYISNAQPIPLTNADINLRSATKPSTMFMKLYGGIAYRGKKYPGVIGISATTEIVGPATALKQWGIWGRVGYSF